MKLITVLLFCALTGCGMSASNRGFVIGSTSYLAEYDRQNRPATHDLETISAADRREMNAWLTKNYATKD